MVQAMERKVRSRARQLYESRGQAEGQELQDWFQAESEVLDNTPIAPLYRRMRAPSPESNNDDVRPDLVSEASGFETAV